tara:strand:- start:346 stop:1122 length:777 start_codon:yes stop_codon:yes gene_type:complete
MSVKNMEWKNYRNWYNDRVMETYISAPIIDKQGDLIPTETLKEAMDFYMKYGIYAYKHDEVPIGVPLAYKIDNGKVKIKVGIHNKLEMHDKVWDEIKSFGSNGASSIRGEATDQKEICPEGENSCYTKVAKLGLWSVSWVGDNPANIEAKVDTVSMAKGDCCEGCGGQKKTLSDYLEEEKQYTQKSSSDFKRHYNKALNQATLTVLHLRDAYKVLTRMGEGGSKFATMKARKAFLAAKEAHTVIEKNRRDIYSRLPPD